MRERRKRKEEKKEGNQICSPLTLEAFGPDPYSTFSVDFPPFFRRFGLTYHPQSSYVPSLYHFHIKFEEIRCEIGRNKPMGAATFLFKIHQFLKPFLSITTTKTLPYNPWTKPKHWLEQHSCFGGRFEYTHNRVSARFWWIWGFSRPNWPWSQVWKLLYLLRSSFLQNLEIFGDSWIFRRVGAADRHPWRLVANVGLQCHF